MRTWRLVLFGREVMRTETVEDPDKTMVTAIKELIDDEGLDEEIEELEAEEEGHSFANFGRIAGEEEHVIFPAEEEDLGHEG